ncbi:MAG: DNA sulfur modification protein DndD [Colwellia sp.]|jgi:DNA sulfur modification protein DndD
MIINGLVQQITGAIMIQAEYLRFLQTLDNEATPKGIIKIANIVLEHIAGLVPLTTRQGQRVRKMAALAQNNWDTASLNIQDLPNTPVEKLPQITKLNNMVVGPFRGFARQEVFDLSSWLVLIYGPNGTGKSSFCEALEYALLGNVAEAESKRFRDQREYLKNAHVNQFNPPIITAEDDQGNVAPLVPNEALYRFCFVEKNRIDSFSRIAAQAPAKQTELISTLFGLESFSEFVRNFTAEIDGRYIDLVGAKGTILNQKRQGLIGAHQQITTNTTELQTIVIEEQGLANQYRKGVVFSQMVYELNGDGQTQGAIQQLETVLQQPVATKSNLASTTLVALGNSIATDLESLTSKRLELAAASQQVSFKQLYDAVSQVQQSSPEQCPACKTPLNQVVVNPYIHANEELQKLQHLAALQQTAQQLEQSIQQSLFSLSQILSTCLRYYPQNNALYTYQLDNNIQPNNSWWNSLLLVLPDTFTPWQHLVSQVKQLEEADRNIVQAVKIKTTQQTELDKHREFARKITVLQTRRQTANKAVEDANQLISTFDTENAQLIADVEAERVVVQKNHTIESSYAGFVKRLNAYNNSLPAQLVADLGEIVVILYNAFNRNDVSSELLANVKLPLAQNQRLTIAFQNDPAKFYDALHVLSEGHIRCIGLAVLLAKNLKENCPFLIFDDPVNAIDDDHRESIRRTLFEDQYFAEKQILLTCHGEEFYKDIHNLLPAQIAKQAQSFSFLPRLDESHIRVDFNCAPRNYILAARDHIDRNEIRESLAKSRQALESLSKGKIWKYVHKHGDGSLSLKLPSPSAPIGLRNLTEQLKSKISKGDFGDKDKNEVFVPIDALLGLNGTSREWRYLNKGTHDENDRAEFDRHTVHTIVSHLEQLDAAID